MNLHTLNKDFLTASRTEVVCPEILKRRLMSLSSVTSDSTVSPSSVDVDTGEQHAEFLKEEMPQRVAAGCSYLAVQECDGKLQGATW